MVKTLVTKFCLLKYIIYLCIVKSACVTSRTVKHALTSAFSGISQNYTYPLQYQRVLPLITL